MGILPRHPTKLPEPGERDRTELHVVFQELSESSAPEALLVSTEL